jgi:signal transduction histidine kinase/tetratricopeptide (TPR) repeat protein
MNRFAEGLLARRKIVLIFLLAILLPALVVGYMSLGAFAKRREAVRRLLESNLSISGESTLRAVEAALLEHEKEALQTKNFARLSGPESFGLPGTRSCEGGAAYSAHFPGTPFLLDGEYRIVFPNTGGDRPSLSSAEEIASESEFSRAFRRAETFEFSQKNFVRAAQAYGESSARANSDREKAVALEATGRCLISAGNLNEARSAYEELGQKYGRIQDRAGHFCGITAAYQIHEIEKRRKQSEAGMRALLDLYQGLKDGNWLVSLPEYEFFTAEIRSLLEIGLQAGGTSEVEKAYQILKDRSSPYLDALLFAEYLKSDVIPMIKERMGVSSLRGSPQLQSDRLLANRGEVYCLVSFAPLLDYDGRSTYCGGFCWDLGSLKKEILPNILAGVSKETGLTVDNVEETRPGSPDAAGGEPTVNDSLLVPYRQFPLPWKLLVTQPELHELERTARRENFLYGALLAFIVVLMLLGAFLLGRDISREAEATRLKTEFVHNISHELKTPLTLIRLYGETLQRKENLTEKQRRESYEIITKESERLSHLINNVLDFSRIDMGRKEFTFAKGSLLRVVQETLDSYRYHLEKKGFRVHEDIASDLPEMTFDREAVASALINLLSNAMKFSPGDKEVTVRLFRREGQAVLQVADKGIGIAPQDLAGVFKRFYRAKSSLVSDTSGSGLGLTLVKHTAEAHGGTVEAESEPGKGSVFSVILPISAPEAGTAK